MALITHRTVQSGFIKAIRALVGDSLADLPVSSGGPLKAVIKDRVKGPRPQFPYIVVDILSTGKTEGSWLRYAGVTEVSAGVFKPFYRSEKTITIGLTCYGEDSHDILTNLEVISVDDFSRDFINSESGAIFQTFSEISENPIFIETDFIDGHTMTATFTAVSEYVPPTGEYIEGVDYTGTILEYEGDPDPIVFSESIDSTP